MNFNFDARTVQPAQPLDAIPAGWYDGAISESEFKPTKDTQGHYLLVGIKVMAGPFAGRMVYDRMNLHNSSTQAVEIAYKTLSAVCHATGVLVITDTQQLHGKPLSFKVAIRAADGKYSEGNEVTGYRPIGQGQPAAGAPPAFAGQPAQPQFAPPPMAPAGAPAWAPPQQQAAPQQQAPAGAPPPWAAGGVPQAPAQAPQQPAYAPQQQQAPAGPPAWAQGGQPAQPQQQPPMQQAPPAGASSWAQPVPPMQQPQQPPQQAAGGPPPWAR